MDILLSTPTKEREIQIFFIYFLRATTFQQDEEEEDDICKDRHNKNGVYVFYNFRFLLINVFMSI